MTRFLQSKKWDGFRLYYLNHPIFIYILSAHYGSTAGRAFTTPFELLSRSPGALAQMLRPAARRSGGGPQSRR